MDIILMFQISFQDYSPAVFIRNLTQQAVQPYANASKSYDRDELRPLLVEVFKWKEFEFMDLVNILGYGKDKYIKITLEQLTDYILEKYLGETAILRYAKSGGYARRDEYIMNKREFLGTLELGLDFLKTFRMGQFSKEFQAIFNQLDRRSVGTISHAEYSLFLKHYLGSESPMAINPTKRVTQLSQSRQMSFPSPQQQTEQRGQAQKQIFVNENVQQGNRFSFSEKGVIEKTALEVFQDLIIGSITQKCRQYDLDRDEMLYANECEQFLYDVLELEPNSISFIIGNYFNFTKANTVSFSEMIQIVCEVHFREILTNIIKNQKHIDIPSKILMQKDYFASKIMQNCYFFPIQPSFELLQRVFEQLLAKSDFIQSDKITLDDFRSFVLVYCCKNKLIFRHQAKKSTQTLANPPASIMEAENSHYEEDQSEGSSLLPSRKQFTSTHKSVSKGNEFDSKDHSMEGGDIGLSSNKRTKTNKLSEESISIQNQLLPVSYPLSSKEVNVSGVKGSSASIKLAQQIEEMEQSRQNIYVEKKKEDKAFKEVLWDELSAVIFKHMSSQQGKLSKSQCDSLFNSEVIFSEDRGIFKDKISRLFSKRVYVEFELIASYIIHLKGEQALIQFNSKQIKGKSTLNQMEISEILYQAYGRLMGLSKESFIQFSKILFIQNAKSLFQYKNYLELIARNLSVKNDF